jgi:hypothetical protein
MRDPGRATRRRRSPRTPAAAIANAARTAAAPIPAELQSRSQDGALATARGLVIGCGFTGHVGGLVPTIWRPSAASRASGLRRSFTRSVDAAAWRASGLLRVDRLSEGPGGGGGGEGHCRRQAGAKRLAVDVEHGRSLLAEAALCGPSVESTVRARMPLAHGASARIHNGKRDGRSDPARTRGRRVRLRGRRPVGPEGDPGRHGSCGRSAREPCTARF